MSFMTNLKQTSDDQMIYTENGATAYTTSGKELLDLHFNTSTMRNWTEERIINAFTRAFYEDKVLAVKWLFYLRDVRGGMGERKSFRIILKELAKIHQDMVQEILVLIPEYGRWDDLWCLLDTNLKDEVIEYIRVKYISDFELTKEGKPISLMAKWMPNQTSKNRETRHYAEVIRQGLGMTPKAYRKVCVFFRDYLNIVEKKMSTGQWSEIDYNTVPSKANVKYVNAFLRHDEQRRREYLDKLTKGDTSVKINSSVNYPYDIVHKYTGTDCFRFNKPVDPALEALWKALPDVVSGGKTLSVLDTSGSMFQRVGNTNVFAETIARSLAFYFSERCTGEYRDKIILFSSRPRYIDLSGTNSLRDKIAKVSAYDDYTNTDIEATFDLILKTAVYNHINQSELPDRVLVISDLEFDRMTNQRVDKSLFDNLVQRFQQHGYKMPKLVFWNVCGRTGGIPLKKNEAGVILVSGFSPNIVNMVMSDCTDPYQALLEQLNVPRYAIVEEMIKKHI